MKNDKLVSVCIPTFNRSELLRRAVFSVLAQTYQNFEIIISDNNSTDIHWSVIDQLSEIDNRITIFRNRENLGFAGNLNSCFERTNGEYILFLCDDDELLPGLLEESVSVYTQYPNVGLVYTDGINCRINGERQRRNIDSPMLLSKGDTAVERIFLKCDLFFSSVLVPKSVYDRVGVFTLTSSADWEMWARIAKDYDIYYISDPLVIYHEHTVSERNPFLYNEEVLSLKNKILGYLKSSDLNLLERRFERGLSRLYFGLGKAALIQGKVSLSWQYYKVASLYPTTFKDVLMVLLHFFSIPIRYLFHPNRDRNFHKTNV